MAKQLDHKLDCKACGTIYLDIPADAMEETPIACSTCGGHLGSWGELRRDFYMQSGNGPLEFDNGRIKKI